MDHSIDNLLRHVVTAGATDLHIKVGSRPVVRVDGTLRRLDEFEPLKPADTQAFAEALLTPKAAADFKSQGSAEFAYGRQELGRFRVTAFRQRGSVSMVLRRVVPGSRSFEELNLPKLLERLAASTSGIMFVTGPSGSGKTTTVSSIVDWINTNRSVSILTIEDPIEVLHPDKKAVVAQREIGVDTPDVASAIRGAMRHDTDVIMLSDIEDVATAQAAFAAAETGHLVITSMRTNDPADTINRLVALFPESQQPIARSQIASQMLCVLSQRLIETRDSGRVLAAELLTNNERAQEWILGGSQPASLVEIIKESEFSGMQTFDQALLKLVVGNMVDLQSVIPYARNHHEVRAKAMAAGVSS